MSEKGQCWLPVRQQVIVSPREENQMSQTSMETKGEPYRHYKLPVSDVKPTYLLGLELFFTSVSTAFACSLIGTTSKWSQ